MKKQLLTALLFCMSGSVYANGFFSPGINTGTTRPPGFMNGTKLYAGGSLGAGQQGDVCNDPFFNGSCDDKDVAWKVFGGARFDPMWGAEAAYNKLGTTSKTGNTSGSSAGLENELTGISVAAVGYVPVATQIEAFGKGGAIFWDRETTQTAGGATTSSKDEGTSPLLGAGVQYQVNDNLHLRGEWEHMFNVGSDSAYETDADLYSIGLMYSTL
ncbi:MAG TPA: outer membrane beta-barrel protein [Candidatus Thiothrix moscowensis]|uniref:outer membrane beta-barrel protein n=1 Tax=unclassified Thiothrix TaxID=2636184 RepID=UPI0025D5C14A|nr:MULTISPECIES: outer membrane beta-barrel protein [unclassified Thiothrix]HRJ52886.1 outer membrane beta-barrel protein [Candidatus Thiothrix moscowensis]HRJ93436.1 outer membrane beta-barrel protein [Candidatus Thiothrix moscowensis]